jgi:hypothetical protein
MKRILSLGIALTLSLTLCVPLLAQQEQPPPKPQPDAPPDPPPLKQGQGDQEQQPEKPAQLQPTLLEKYMKQLSSDSSLTRELALKELVKMGEKAVPELNKLLGVGPAEEAPDLPGELKARIEKLIKELDADEWAVREAATKELEKIGEDAENYLRRVARFGTPEVKTRAEKLLAKLEKERRGGKSEEEVERANFQLKLCAARALGEIASSSCAKGLLAALADSDKMINTTALMCLRKKSGWSFGFGPKNLENNRRTVVEKWTSYLDKPVKPSGEEAIELKAGRKAGDVFRTVALWSIESTTTRITRSTVITRVGKDKQPKREERVNTYTYITKLAQQQDFTDSLKKSEPGVLSFTRKYDTHQVESSYSTRRPGAGLIPANRNQSSTALAGTELEFLSRPGFSDVKVLKGNISLAQRQQLSASIVGLEALLPGKPVRPGDSWDMPELAAFKLLRSLEPKSAGALDISSLKIKCTLLEVVDKDGSKTARISILAKFGPKQDASQVIRAAGNIVRISSSFGYGNTLSLADSTLTGDLTFDLDSGAVTSLKLFGTLIQAQPPDARFGSRTIDNSAYGHFSLEVKASRKKSEDK